MPLKIWGRARAAASLAAAAVAAVATVAPGDGNSDSDVTARVRVRVLWEGEAEVAIEDESPPSDASDTAPAANERDRWSGCGGAVRCGCGGGVCVVDVAEVLPFWPGPPTYGAAFAILSRLTE